MRTTYKQALERLHASEELKRRVLASVQQNARPAHTPLFAALSAVAAVVALVLTYTVLSLPAPTRTCYPAGSATTTTTTTTTITATTMFTTTTSAAIAPTTTTRIMHEPPRISPSEQHISLSETQAANLRALFAVGEWRKGAIKGIPEYIFVLDDKEYWLSVTDGWCYNRDDYAYVRFFEEDTTLLRDMF